MDIILGIFAAVIVCVFAWLLCKNIARWHKNNSSPRITVVAEVTSKRTASDWVHAGNGAMIENTCFYVTFRTEEADVVELRVKGKIYRMLSEGDAGRLTFQGTRFISFETGVTS